MPKAEKKKGLKALKKERQAPLYEDIAALSGKVIEDSPSAKRKYVPSRIEATQESDGEDDVAEGTVLDAALSAKILGLANIDNEEFEDPSAVANRLAEFPQLDEDVLPESQWADVDFEDEAADAVFQRALQNSGNAEEQQQRTLTDLILEKLHETESAAANSRSDADGPSAPAPIAPELINVYTSVGAFMKRYRHGRIPKAFKVIPRLRNWEEVLYLTNPSEWSPNAMREATRIFASNLSAPLAARFFKFVLLPAIREDIANRKKLNVHYFEALKHTAFKPAAMFKGILFPLVAHGDCTLRESVIVGSVLSKVSLPPLHTAAALIKLTRIPAAEWTSALGYLIAVLLNKKAALPMPAVDAAVNFFGSFESEENRVMPVIWHTGLLSLVQRYKNDLSSEHRQKIRDVLHVHCHKSIAPEIRRELQYAPIPFDNSSARAVGVA